MEEFTKIYIIFTKPDLCNINNIGLCSLQSTEYYILFIKTDLYNINNIGPGGEWYGILVFITAYHSKGWRFKLPLGHFCGFYSLSL